MNRPWSNIGTAHRLIILDICAKFFVNPSIGSKDIEQTRDTVIQCLILDCDLDLEPTLVKHGGDIILNTLPIEILFQFI